MRSSSAYTSQRSHHTVVSPLRSGASSSPPHGRTGSGLLAMTDEERKRTIVLGAEYDDALCGALRAVLQELGAMKASTAWGVGGSQEIETAVVRIGSHEISIEAETYAGLSVSGDADFVGTIADRLSKRLKSEN